MKELGITKGEFRLKTNVHPTTDGKRWGWVGLDKVRPYDSVKGLNITWEEGTKTEMNAKLIVDTFNTSNKTGLLPSELLQRYNEAIEALEQIKDLCKPSNQNEFAIKSIAEQTISKAKP